MVSSMDASLKEETARGSEVPVVSIVPQLKGAENVAMDESCKRMCPNSPKDDR
jgi:hypothetical protein